jgi:hypothetical protein
MDLALYARVIWRFRLIVLAGLLLAIVLALLSFVRVSFKGGSPTLTYRQAEAWQSTTQLDFGGIAGFPRALVPIQSDPSNLSPGAIVRASPGDLAVRLALYANSDAVRGLIARDRSLHGSVIADYGVDPNTDQPRGTLQITGTATDPKMAMRVAARGVWALRTYIEQRSRAADIPRAQRVRFTTLNAPIAAVVVTKRKMTVPIVVFLTVMIAAIGLAFVLENLRPRMRLVENRPETELPRHRDSA